MFHGAEEVLPGVPHGGRSRRQAWESSNWVMHGVLSARSRLLASVLARRSPNCFRGALLVLKRYGAGWFLCMVGGPKELEDAVCCESPLQFGEMRKGPSPLEMQCR